MSLEPRLLADLRSLAADLQARSEFLPAARLERLYALFRVRFGPEALAGLDGQELLLKMHGREAAVSLCRSWAHARELAGIPDVRLHDLRHSVASDAIMNGVPLEVVGKVLGHRNYHTTQRYAHIADNVLRDAVNMTSKTIVQAGQNGTSKARKGSPAQSRRLR